MDGSKFKAVNSRLRNLTRAKLNKTLKRIDAQIEPYLHDLDTADAEEAASQKPTAEELQGKIWQLRSRKGRYEGLRCERSGTPT
jgi:hypothetical protein